MHRDRADSRRIRRFVQPQRDEEPDAIVERVAASSVNPEDAAQQHQLHRAIGDAIRALAPKLRDALLLAQSGDYSYEEIGAMLKTPIGTIKWRVSEARRVVKVRLREGGHL